MTIPGTDTVLEIVGFPGTAAAQCGISSEVTEDNRSGEQPAQGWQSRGYLPHFDTSHVIQHITCRLTEQPAAACSLPQSASEQMQAELNAYSGAIRHPNPIESATQIRFIPPPPREGIIDAG